MTQTPQVIDPFVQRIRVALADRRTPGFVTADELREALATLPPSLGAAGEVQADVAQDLLDRSYRPRRLGGVPMAVEGRALLAAFVTRHDVERPGLWRDAPRGGGDDLARFLDGVRHDTASGRRLGAARVQDALRALDRAPVASGIKAHLAEGLLLASDAHRGTEGLPIEERAAELLTDFVRDRDPTRQGIGWFEPPGL